MKIFRFFLGLWAIAVLIFAADALAKQCVEFIYEKPEFADMKSSGYAWKWWGAANGKYERGNAPKKGAVLVFKQAEWNKQFGHVAYVSNVISESEILIDHANWSPSGAVDGKEYYGIKVQKASGDWTKVKVWFQNDKYSGYGKALYETYGFIYPTKIAKQTSEASPARTQTQQSSPQPQANNYSLSFVKHITIHDGTIMKPGQEFEKQWELKNTGNVVLKKDTVVIVPMDKDARDLALQTANIIETDIAPDTVKSFL